MVRLDRLTREQTKTLLALYECPALRAGGGDLERARFTQEAILPSLAKACERYGIQIPGWLQPYRI